MKVADILQQYAEGRRDFRNLSLRGKSFQGQNLSGADFSGCDLRGTNFKGAILKRTRFSQAKAGLQKRWVITLVLISWLVSAFSGFLSIFSSFLISNFFRSGAKDIELIIGIILIFSLIFILIAITRQGLNFAIVLAVAITLAFAGAFSVSSAFFIAEGAFGLGTFTLALAVAFVFAGDLALAVAVALALVVAGDLAVAVAVGLAVAIVGILVEALNIALTNGLAVAIGLALAVVVVGSYLGWRSLQGNPKDTWIRQTAIAFAATGGTSFYGADLTKADFTEAILKNTDFREVNLTQTCWRKTKKLDRVRPGKTLLANEAVRDLMVTGKGESKSYEKRDLRGANLKGVNLNYANLKCADLSEATLEEADLEYANLTEVNAVETNFTRAKMTGVCLEAWNIESNTKLDKVDCRFVYLLEHPKLKTDDRERRPSSGIFQPGEFTKLFQEVLNTVDLIFQDGLDWKAFVTAFKKLQIENEDIPLEIQSIENKGDGVVVVKVAVASDTNKAKIHQDFTQNYERELKLIEDKYKAQLKAKENEIAIYRQTNIDMKEIAQTLANRPIKVETKAMAQGNINQDHSGSGDNIAGDKTNINQQGNFGVGVNQGEISGNAKIAGVINEAQRQELAKAAKEIQALLDQLSETYPTETKKEKRIFAVEAIDLIEQNPSLTKKLLSAGKAGSLAALESMLNHPAAYFVMAALEDLEEN